jgi:predicted nuclease of predicted toxin-antitoxin system
MSDIAFIVPKVVRLLPLLASDHDGEVVATARAIDRTLKSAGLDLHDLAQAMAAPKISTVHGGHAAPQPAQRPTSLRDIAVWLRTHVGTRMDYKEQKFVADMAARLAAGCRASKKQENWLRNIYAWYGGDVP